MDKLYYIILFLFDDYAIYDLLEQWPCDVLKLRVESVEVLHLQLTYAGVVVLMFILVFSKIIVNSFLIFYPPINFSKTFYPFGQRKM